ncbi:MAG: DUF721 domain-containing protein [Deltaproteobacteria bacterium]|nr:DUF721 domain-containing protein [Deltaproteobacteria bacterium]
MQRRPVRTKPVTAAAALEQMLRRQGLFDEMRAQRAIAVWPELAGPALARVSEPLFIDQGTLVVRVGSPTWRTELHHLLPTLLERINQQLETPLRAIRLVARRPSRPIDRIPGGPELAPGQTRVK